MKEVLILNTIRGGYSPGQCGGTLTVGELIRELEDFDPDLEIYTGHDNQYTYGAIQAFDLDIVEFDEE